MIGCKRGQSKKKQANKEVILEKGLIELSETENYLFIRVTDKETKEITIYSHKYQK